MSAFSHRGAGKAPSIFQTTIAAVISFGAAWGATVPALAQEARVALSGGLDLIDPTRTSNGNDLIVVTQIYETLLDSDPQSGALKPKLAESYSLKSPTVWEFRLRAGIKFQDGSPLTAQDVKYSIERVLDPSVNSPHSSQVASVSSVNVIDDLTVQVVTKTPDPLLPRRMQPTGGSGRVFIVPKAYFESRTKQEVNDQPMGTGPYRFVEWRKGQSLTIARNETYWGKKPEVQTGKFTFIPENSTRVNALLREEVDIIQRLPIGDVDRIEKANNAHVVLSMNGHVHTLQVDMRKPPFDDIEVRKALAHAINIESIVKNLFGKYGRVLGVPMAPNVTQYDASIQPYKFDRDLSKKILANKPPIELNTYTSDGRYVADRETYQALNAQLQAVGFKIKPQTLEWGRFISMMQSRTAGPMYFIGWDFGEGDASKMNSFLKSNGGLSIVADPTYDRLADEAGQEMDETKRTALWKKVQSYVHDQYYIPAVWQGAAIFGFSKKFDWDGATGETLDLSGVKLVK